MEDDSSIKNTNDGGSVCIAQPRAAGSARSRTLIKSEIDSPHDEL